MTIHTLIMKTTTTSDTTIRPFSGSRYAQNSEKAECADLLPCAICGKGCASWIGAVHVIEGGSRFATKEEHENPATEEDAGDMGCFPVGPECARKIRKTGAHVFSFEG